MAADALGAIALEVSNDGVRWAPVASSSQSFTLAADVLIFEVQLNSNYVRTSTTITSGGNGTLFQTFVAEKIMPGY